MGCTVAMMHHSNPVIAEHMPHCAAHRLPQSHLVCQNAIESVLVEADQPGHACQLVGTQLTLDKRDQCLYTQGKEGWLLTATSGDESGAT